MRLGARSRRWSRRGPHTVLFDRNLNASRAHYGLGGNVGSVNGRAVLKLLLGTNRRHLATARQLFCVRKQCQGAELTSEKRYFSQKTRTSTPSATITPNKRTVFKTFSNSA